MGRQQYQSENQLQQHVTNWYHPSSETGSTAAAVPCCCCCCCCCLLLPAILAKALFDHIPVGVGSQGIIPTTVKDLEAALEMGMDWSLRWVWELTVDKLHRSPTLQPKSHQQARGSVCVGGGLRGTQGRGGRLEGRGDGGGVGRAGMEAALEMHAAAKVVWGAYDIGSVCYT
jgi:hypothetical protein